MSSFTTPLQLEYLDGCRWKVTQPFTYYVGDLGTGEPITVPAGFLTDFASVPRGLWNLFPPTGPYGKAAVIHDFLYSQQTGTRKEADDIFLEAMGVLDVGRFTKYTVYWAVRLGGGQIWARHTRELAEVHRVDPAGSTQRVCELTGSTGVSPEVPR